MTQKLKEKKLGVHPLPFFRNFSRFFFVEFLTFDGWNCFRGTNNCFYNRLLPAYLIYHS